MPIFLNRLIFGEDTDNDKVERFLDTVYTCVAGKTSIGGQTFEQSGRAETCLVYRLCVFPDCHKRCSA